MIGAFFMRETQKGKSYCTHFKWCCFWYCLLSNRLCRARFSQRMDNRMTLQPGSASFEVLTWALWPLLFISARGFICVTCWGMSHSKVITWTISRISCEGVISSSCAVILMLIVHISYQFKSVFIFSTLPCIVYARVYFVFFCLSGLIVNWLLHQI